MSVDMKSLMNMIQLSLLRQVSSGTSITSEDDSGSSSGIDFSSMLMTLLEQTALDQGNTGLSSGSNAGTEWVKNQSVTGTTEITGVEDGTSGNIKSTSGSSSDIEAAVQEAAQKYGIDASFIKAIIHQESGFNPNAVSGAGAEGLMQLMPGTAKAMGVGNPFDVMQNVDGGTKYIKSLIDAFKGNKELALSAYNGGIGRMNKRGVDTVEEISKMPGETQSYVDKVMKAYKSYNKG